VVVAHTQCEPTDPHYSVSKKRLAGETPNSWYVNQYDHTSDALYIITKEQTGP
jgi:cystathionine beta-synthase